MTQKELDYIKDAIEHEDNVIKILNDNIKNMKDDGLVKFLKKEIKTHQDIHKKLMTLLGGKAWMMN